MNKNPKVAIIILNWNGFGDTCECIESLIKSNYSNYQIMIVDNNSKNNEGNKLEKKYKTNKKITVIKNKTNSGYCGGNNLGFNYARRKNYDYAVILNNDTEVANNLLTSMVDKFQKDNKVYIIGATIAEYDRQDIIQTRGFIINNINFTSEPVDHKRNINSKQLDIANSVSGCCFMVRCDIPITELFDENFFCYYEEIDLCLRIIGKGGKITIDKDAIVYHKGSISSKKLFGFTEYQMAKNIFLLQKKHSNSNSLQKVLLILHNISFLFYKLSILIRRNEIHIIPHFAKGYGHGLLIFFGANPDKFKYKTNYE